MPLSSPHSNQRFTMMGLMLMALLLCYIDRTIISIAAIEMQKEYGWSDSQKGLMLSLFSVGYLTTQLLGGILSNKFGGRNVYLFCVVFWSVTTVLTPTAAATSFAVLLVARVALGVGEGATYPASYNLISQWMAEHERARSLGLISSAAAVGTVGALLVTGLLIAQFGWPSVFYLFGGLGLLWSILWWQVIPAQAPAAGHAGPAAGSDRAAIPWRILLTHPAILTLYVVNFGGQAITVLMASWLPSYLVDTFSVSTRNVGFLAMLPWITLAVATYAGGHYADRCRSAGEDSLRLKRRLLSSGFVVVILALLGLVVTQQLPVAIALVLIMFGGVGVIIPAFSTIPGELLPRHSDVLFGIVCAVGAIGSLAFVFGAGLLLDHTGSYDAIFSLLALACCFSLGFFLVFGRTREIAYGEPSAGAGS